ncbi:CopG family transcriptional regulator [Rhodoferax sp. 4810]|nr:CopG family transcriptional regulator [Rhodoferax jenense]
MSTTTIRIEDDLKTRVAAAAQHMGKSAHAFIVDALAERVAQVELDAAFHAVANERWANIRATGKTVAWDETKTYLAARAKGESPRMPVARKLSK